MKVIKLNAEAEDIKKIRIASNVIKNGGIVAFPTETVYGLGADAYNPKAVARIFEVKNRPQFDPLIVHIADFSYVKKLSSLMDERIKKLTDTFWPGPLTLVVPKKKIVPDIVTAGLETVALRMPAHNVALELIRESKTPIAAPSANPFGYISPTTAEHVKEQLGQKVDLILDSGKCPIGVESTVLDITSKKATLLRPGGLPLEEIEGVIGKIKLLKAEPQKPQSPGQLPYHYSPKTRVKLIEKNSRPEPKKSKRAGLLAFTPPEDKSHFEVVEVLSKEGDFREAAANLFSCLHNLDVAGLDIIYAERVPEIGLGRAIMDRLYKASGKGRK